jgi:5-methylcytosine-specific restriction endonuclease McrA
MGFEYDLSVKPGVRISEERMLAELRAFGARRKGRAFGVRAYAAWRGRTISQNTVIRRFGSWRKAQMRAGLVGAERVRERRYQAAELVDELERVWREIGRAPGETTLPRMGRFSLSAYKKRWGSVRRLCELVERQHRGEITRAEVERGVEGIPERKTIPMDVRWRVLRRDRYRCRVCGRNPATGAAVELNIDHIVPVARGGGNEERNLRVLCRECNVGKGTEGEGVLGAEWD